jgi:hypothetical protein
MVKEKKSGMFLEWTIRIFYINPKSNVLLHLKLLKLQYVSNKPPRLLLSFNLFLTYPEARLPLMHSTYLNHCMIFGHLLQAYLNIGSLYVCLYALPPDKAGLDTLEAFKAAICVQ